MTIRFWTYLKAASESSGLEESEDISDAQTTVKGLAAAKLIGHSDYSKVKGNPAACLAVLDTLLNLQYDPLRMQNTGLADVMVAGHMRTAFSVPIDRASMLTGYPSEPVLAEAALDVVEALKEPDPLGLLFSKLESGAGAIDKGERGENIGKLILLRAYMEGVKKEAASSSFPNWRNGCGLVTFLECLTAQKFEDVVLGCCPDNIVKGTPLRDAFKDAWVRFTHFARAADDSAMTTTMAWIAFLRGMAMIGWHSQIAVDVHIPILLNKDAPITEANMSGILVQFKVRDKHSNKSDVAVDVDKVRYFPPAKSPRNPTLEDKAFFPNPATNDDWQGAALLAYRTRPYISLVMELGVIREGEREPIKPMVVEKLDNSSHSTSQPKEHLVRSHKPQQPSVSQIEVATAPTKETRSRTSEEAHPRYSLFFYGCSEKVYRCIPADRRGIYKTLLQIGGILGDHPPNRPIDPVLQMKPFWTIGDNCFSWVNEHSFRPKDTSESSEPSDGVVAGSAYSPVDIDPKLPDGDITMGDIKTGDIKKL